MIDFDGFKAINDVHGHDFGDQALAAFAQALRGCLRDFDVPARLGGDEFAVLLPGTRLPDAVGIAERVRATVNSLAVEHGGRRAALSVSIGVADWLPDSKAPLEESVRGADRALLHAKSLGGGRIGVFEDGAVRAVAPGAAAAPAGAAPSTRGRRRAREG
jgi:diguanylate cyclase (GGDEF)-like protein